MGLVVTNYKQHPNELKVTCCHSGDDPPEPLLNFYGLIGYF